MAKAGYSIVTGGAVGLTAATAKTILGAKSHANFGLDLIEFALAFDGVTAANSPVLVELCYATFATNSPGTNSTSVTPAQMYGRALTVGFTAAKTWTTEPTVLTPIKELQVTPNGGVFEWAYPLGQSPDTALAEGLVIRCTAAQTVNVRASMTFERC
jgi:hypothetical protein